MYCLKKRFICILFVFVLTAVLAAGAGNVAAAGIDVGEIEYIDISDEDMKTLYSDHVAYDVERGRPITLSGSRGAYLYYFDGELSEEGAEVESRLAEPIAFTDIPGSSNYYVDYLSARGIVQGNPDGTFGGDAFVSRAEACAMLARLFGIETADFEPIYEDVAADAWYSGYVCALNRLGVVETDENFNPDRTVTREELNTMFYRILKQLPGFEEPPEEGYDPFSNSLDAALISQYAVEAYAGLGYNGYIILDQTTAYEGDKGYYNPQVELNRYNTAELFRLHAERFMFLNYPAIAKDGAIEYGFDQEMPVIDGSTSSYPITQAVYYRLFENAENHPNMPKAHSKTIESYKRLINGEADIIIVPDPSEDVTALAEQSGVELKFIPIANEALVFFTNGSNSVSGLTTEQIKDIYINNAYDNWSQLGGEDAAFAAYCRNNDSGSHAQMEKFFLDGQEINEDIRRENISLAMASILTDVADYGAQNPGSYALGYSMYYYFNAAARTQGPLDLKLLAVDGITPSDETIADGSYGLATYYYAVLRADEPEDSPASKMAEYLLSDAGQECISNAGFGVVGISD
ncbi:MAG TPA: S-layer homology domain-containing protein [Firmicutes bacterium]|nr:S-layer homology domain-containing protein [Bacillota bacterium]